MQFPLRSWESRIKNYADRVHLNVLEVMRKTLNLNLYVEPFPIEFIGKLVSQAGVNFNPDEILITKHYLENPDEYCARFSPTLEKRVMLDDLVFAIAHETGHILHFNINPGLIKKHHKLSQILKRDHFHPYRAEQDKIEGVMESSIDFFTLLYFETTRGEKYLDKIRVKTNQKLIDFNSYWNIVKPDRLDTYLSIPKDKRTPIINRLLRANSYRAARNIPEVRKYFQKLELQILRQGY